MSGKLILKHNKEIIDMYNPEHPNVKIRYNLKARSMQKWIKELGWVNTSNQYDYFRWLTIEDIECEEGKGEKFKEILKLAKLINSNCFSVSTFISRMDKVLVYENYILNGINYQCERYWSGSYEILTKPLEFYSKNMIKFFKEYKIKVTTKLEEECEENYEFMEKVFTILLHTKLDEENAKDFVEKLVSGYTMERFRTLVLEYRYDMASLIKYIYEYLIPFENLTVSDSLELLKDYYEMANRIGREVKRYPKYLRSMHDIITANYNAYKKEYDEQFFYKLRRPELEFEGKEYCTVIPSSSKDIIQEGTDLNHCVGSYVDKILAKKTYIFFLRKTKLKEQSLITLELKDDTIMQAKGAYNRAITKEEKDFLEAYCKKMKFKLNGTL